MPRTRNRFSAAIAAIGVLAVVAPYASAGTTGFGLPLAAGGFVPFGASRLGNAAGALGPCSRANAQQQGGTAAVNPQVCVGMGLVFVGPTVGQIASVIGPRIIGPAALGNSAVAAGNVAVGGVG